jgi:REP element-mobilizing transposase RayT
MNRPNHFHSHDLRGGRRSIPGQVYLVTTTNDGRRPLFADFFVAACASRALAEAGLWRDSHLLAWVLKPDHWHGLIELGGNESLSKVVGRAKAVSAAAVNLERGGRGAVWQPGFHDRALRCDDSLTAAARYLIANPLRAGLVATPGDYAFWDSVWPGVESDLG